MPLNNFSFFVLTPNTSGTVDIPVLTTDEVELASLTIDTTGSTSIKLDSLFGWHAIGSGATGLVVRIRRDSITGQVVVRGRDKSTFSGSDNLDLTALNHVDSETNGSQTYVLTAALDQATFADGNRAKVIGPITFTGVALG